jgi:hypothetical protein
MLIGTASPLSLRVFKKTMPERTVPVAVRSGRPSTNAAYYGFADEAAADAASAAALAAEASLAAALASAAAEAGGVASAAGAGGASVLLPQALRITAATKALRASLVFIYRYPRNFEW